MHCILTKFSIINISDKTGSVMDCVKIVFKYHIEMKGHENILNNSQETFIKRSRQQDKMFFKDNRCLYTRPFKRPFKVKPFFR